MSRTPRSEFLQVECPVKFCNAKINELCQTKGGDPLTPAQSHQGRKEAVAALPAFSLELPKEMEIPEETWPDTMTPMKFEWVHTDPNGRVLVSDDNGYLYWLTEA